MLHEDCYNYFVTFNEGKGIRLICPMCRAPVDKSKTVKKILHMEATTAGPDDPFYMEGKPGDKQVIDNVSEMPPVATGPAQPIGVSINNTNINDNSNVP